MSRIWDISQLVLPKEIQYSTSDSRLVIGNFSCKQRWVLLVGGSTILNRWCGACTPRYFICSGDEKLCIVNIDDSSKFSLWSHGASSFEMLAQGLVSSPHIFSINWWTLGVAQDNRPSELTQKVLLPVLSSALWALKAIFAVWIWVLFRAMP